MAKLERDFQAKLIKELKAKYPEAYVMKMDPVLNQGIPDLLILYKGKWATLECKRSSTASKRPNQERHVEKMNEMSFSRFIYPENKKEVLDELQRSFEA